MAISSKQLTYIWRTTLYLASISLLAWLFYQNLVPSGVLVLHYKKGDPSSLISDLYPEKRTIGLKEDGPNQRFFLDPVYFDVKVPRAFDKVIVDIAWQNQSQPILELGARKVRGEFGFVLKSLQNKMIDDILTPPPKPPLPLLGKEETSSKRRGLTDWSCQREDESLFCQKVKKYDGLNTFFAQPAGKVLVYRYKPPANIKYDAMNIETQIDRYDYLIANYSAPQSLGNDWYRRRLEYNWQDFALDVNEISFLLSAPQLNQGHGQIVVGDIKVTLRRPPLDWPGLVGYIKNQLRRLRK